MVEQHVRRTTAVRATDVGVVEGGFSKLSWRSVFGGMFAALGVWILLATFGWALGLTMISPEDPSLTGVGAWLGVWSLIVPILAMSVGTLVATRASAGTQRGTGILYGTVVWGVTTFAGTVLAVWLMGSVIGQTLQASTNVIAGVGGAAGSVAQSVGVPSGGDVSQAGGDIASFLDIDRSEIEAALNDQLQQAGLPPLQPEQLQAAIQSAVDTALRQGEISTEIFVDALVQETQLERSQVQQAAQQLQQQWDELVGSVTGQLESVASAAGDTALRSLDAIGNAMWWIFGSMLLGLLAAIGTGVLATNGKRAPTPAQRIPVARLEEAHAVG